MNEAFLVRKSSQEITAKDEKMFFRLTIFRFFPFSLHHGIVISAIQSKPIKCSAHLNDGFPWRWLLLLRLALGQLNRAKLLMVMQVVGIVGSALQVQGHETFRVPGRVENRFVLERLLNWLLAVHDDILVVVARHQLDLLLLILLLIIHDHHRVNGVSERGRAEGRCRDAARLVFAARLQLLLAVRRRQSLPRQRVDEQRVLLEILLDGIFLRKNPRAVRLPLVHRRRHIVVHNVGVRRAEQHIISILQLELIWHR